MSTQNLQCYFLRASNSDLYLDRLHDAHRIFLVISTSIARETICSSIDNLLSLRKLKKTPVLCFFFYNGENRRYIFYFDFLFIFIICFHFCLFIFIYSYWWFHYSKTIHSFIRLFICLCFPRNKNYFERENIKKKQKNHVVLRVPILMWEQPIVDTLWVDYTWSWRKTLFGSNPWIHKCIYSFLLYFFLSYLLFCKKE